jgi:hypothetical protein
MLKNLSIEERKEAPKGGAPVQNKVIPRYNEFANGNQYKNPKAKVNPGFTAQPQAQTK